VFFLFSENVLISLENWHPNLCVGDVFKMIDEGFLDDYTTYVQNYTEAHMLLKKEAKKKLFKEFLAKQKLDVRSKGRELDQFLIMPVQRIPRYHLLLRELVKHTWSTHPDFAVNYLLLILIFVSFLFF
jgi:hypothetical protein